MSQSSEYPIEVTLVDAQGQALERGSHDADTTVGALIVRARQASPALGEGELLATWQAHPLAPQMTLIEVLFGFPVDDGPLEIVIAPRADRAGTGRIRRESASRYLTLDRVLEELEVEYEELAGLVADGKIRAFRVEDTTRFSKADVLALKQLKPAPTPTPSPAWLDLSLADALAELDLAEQELVRLVSEGEIRAYRDGDEIRFRRTDIDAHRNRHRGSYYALPEALRRLGVAGRELARLVSEGQLRAFRDGDEMWFRKSDVDERSGPAPGDENRFFTCEDVQRILGTSESELARMVADGEIRAFRDGNEIRFPRLDVGAVLAERAIHERLARTEETGAPRAWPAPPALAPEPAPAAVPAPSPVRDAVESTTLRLPVPAAPATDGPLGLGPIQAVDPLAGAAGSVFAVGTDPVSRAAPTAGPPPAFHVPPTSGAGPAPGFPSAMAGSARRAARPGSESSELGIHHADETVGAPTVLALEARWRPPVIGRTSSVMVAVAPTVAGESADGELRLVVHGAMVASAALGIVAGRASGVIAIHPLIAGLLDARLEVWHAGALVPGALSLPLEARARPWLAAIAQRLALVFPLAGLALALVRAPDAAAGGIAAQVDTWVRSQGGWELVGLAAGAASLLVALLARALGRPGERVARGEVSLGAAAPASVAATPRSRAREAHPPTAEMSWPGCVAAGTTSAGFRAHRHLKTGIELVEIPAGVFWRGARDDDTQSLPHERPCRQIALEAFLVGRVPVTVSQFRRFAAEVPEWDERRAGSPEADDGYLKSWRRGLAQRAQPVTEISWFAAVAFCAWADLVLPTEAQWEKAARGTHGDRFPWGNAWPTPELARFADTHLAPVWDGGRYVGTYAAGASPYGVLEMAGNALEWVADRYDPGAHATGPDRDPPGPATGFLRVARGGSFQSPPEALRTTARHPLLPTTSEASLGFRVALGPASAVASVEARRPRA